MRDTTLAEWLADGDDDLPGDLAEQPPARGDGVVDPPPGEPAGRRTPRVRLWLVAGLSWALVAVVWVAVYAGSPGEPGGQVAGGDPGAGTGDGEAAAWSGAGGGEAAGGSGAGDGEAAGASGALAGGSGAGDGEAAGASGAGALAGGSGGEPAGASGATAGEPAGAAGALAGDQPGGRPAGAPEPGGHAPARAGAPASGAAGARPSEVELAGAAVLAVRLALTEHDEQAGSARYVDLAVPTGVRWYGGVAVVTVDALVYEGGSGGWGPPRPGRYAQPVRPTPAGPVPAGRPWSLPVPDLDGGPPGYQPVLEPEAAQRAQDALEAAGYREVDVREVLRPEGLSGIVVAAVEATAPGDPRRGEHEVWISEEAAAVLGSASAPSGAEPPGEGES